MNKAILAMSARTEGRYLTQVETAMLKKWAAGLDARTAAMAEVEGKEGLIVSQVVAEVGKRYPDFVAKHGAPSQKGLRDLTIVLRYAAAAMVWDDEAYLHDGLLSWLHTILRGVGFTNEFLADTYKMLEQAAESHLSAQSYARMAPYLEACTRSLADQVTEAAA